MADRKPQTEHKSYPSILNVTTFDAKGHGPRIMPLTLVAALTPSTNYPRSRLMLCNVLGSAGMTVHQAAMLRDQLDAAIAEVLRACPEMATPDDQQLPKEMPRG